MLDQNPLVVKIKKIALQEASDDMAGDQYEVGYIEGRVDLAREILDTLGIEY